MSILSYNFIIVIIGDDMKRNTIIALIFTLTFLFSLCLSQTVHKTEKISGTVIDDKVNLVIDAGHGGEDCGTIGTDGALEKDINLAIALDLYDFARVCGYSANLTRGGDYLVYSEDDDRSRSDLYNRFDYINSFDNPVLISIHQNHFDDEREWGMQVWYSPNDDVSKILADEILNYTKHNIQPENKRENKKSDSSYYIIHKAKVPSVMVECGFMSNKAENEKLKNEIYQKDIAFSVFAGFNEYIDKV